MSGITIEQFLEWLKFEDVDEEIVKQLVLVAERRLNAVLKAVEQHPEAPTTMSERIAEVVFYTLDKR